MEKTSMLSFAGLISVTFDPKFSNGTSNGGSNGSHDHVTSSTDSEDLPVLDTASDKQVLQFGILHKDAAWDNARTHVDNAKASASKSDVEWPGSRVYIDLDPQANESSEKSDSNISDLVKSVSFALGLDTTKELWSTSWSCSCLFSPSSHVFFLVKRAHLHRFVVSYNGRIAVNTECVGFWSKSIAGDIRYRVPLSRVKTVKPHDRGRSRDHTLAIEIQGQQDLRLGFSTERKRDEAVEQINRFISLAQDRYSIVSSPTTLTLPSTPFSPSDDIIPRRRVQSPDQMSEVSTLPDNVSIATRHNTYPSASRNATSILAPLSRVPSTLQKQHVPHAVKSILPKAINVPEGVLLSMPSMHFVCLTIGSRGDVQPYIALGRGLQKEGHKVTIVTHEEYKAWVTGFGIDHRTAGGDPGALMKLSVENKVFGT
jgi:sterol 3beta-glucosyltransferase